MNAVDIAVIVTVCLAVAGIIACFVYRKIKHKGGGCGCGCDGCCPRCKRK